AQQVPTGLQPSGRGLKQRQVKITHDECDLVLLRLLLWLRDAVQALIQVMLGPADIIERRSLGRFSRALQRFGGDVDCVDVETLTGEEEGVAAPAAGKVQRQ